MSELEKNRYENEMWNEMKEKKVRLLMADWTTFWFEWHHFGFRMNFTKFTVDDVCCFILVVVVITAAFQNVIFHQRRQNVFHVLFGGISVQYSCLLSSIMNNRTCNGFPKWYSLSSIFLNMFWTRSARVSSAWQILCCSQGNRCEIFVTQMK